MKYSGEVGYVMQEETEPGVWRSVEKIRKMRGDVLYRGVSNNVGAKMNDDINLNNRISVLGDAFAFENYVAMKWVTLGNAKWEVTLINVEPPRLVLTIGGPYHG